MNSAPIDVGELTSLGRVVDLTHPFDERTIYWPTEEGFRFERGPAGITEKGYFYVANSFAAAEHGGTHMDAPIHFREQGVTADKVPLSRLIGAAAVVDVSAQCAANRDHQVTIDDFRKWEETHHRPLHDVIVLLRTGFAAHWPNQEKYLGTAEHGPDAIAKLSFPGLHPDAAQWLAENRRVLAVGIDTASIDFGRTTYFQSHVTLFGRGIPVFENVADLSGLPETGCTVIALPMKIAGGSGGPLRIVALIPAGDR